MRLDSKDFSVVTGAYGYVGRHIARRLLSDGRQVKTLTTRFPPDGHQNAPIVR